MWLLAGCHLFSSGTIPKTCEDVGACDDSSPPIPGEPSRLLAALACSPCSTDTDASAQYVADLWLVPAIGAAFPQLTQATAWEGPVAYDTRAAMAFVASGGSVVALGPERDDLAPFGGLVQGDIVGMAATDGLVVLTTGDAVYGWKPEEGRTALARLDAGDEGQIFEHVFLDDADEPGMWVAGRANGIDLWKIDGASMTLEVEALATDAELAGAGMFVGKDGAFSGCDRSGVVFRFDAKGTEPVGHPTDVVRAVGCGYDPGLGGHLVLDADRGALFLPDGSDEWGIYASPPNDGRVLVGTIVP
jgi:hypothetical protein